MKFVLLIIAVVFAAGCTSQLPTFGLDAISVNKEISIEGDRDVLAIRDKLTIPKSPILTDQSVQFSYVLENKDTAKKAENVRIDLFDAPLMKRKSSDGPLCNFGRDSSGNFAESRSCFPNECKSRDGNACVLSDILPGEQRQVTFDLFSPSQGQIAGLKTDLKMNFKVTYNFEGSTSFTVPVVNLEEITARQRAGDKIKVDVTKSIGSGPIQVDPELFGSSYILGGQSGTFFFVIKNKGKGNLPSSQVPKGGLCVYFPKEFFTENTILVNPDGIECRGPECQKGNAATGEVISKYISDITGTGDKPLVTGYATDARSYRCYSSSSNACLEPYPTLEECQNACSDLDVSCIPADECLQDQGGSGTAVPAATQQKKSDPLFDCMSVSSAPDAGCYEKDKPELSNMVLCYNSRAIELFRDESRVSMRFSIHKISEIKDQPFRSMTVISRIKYPYELRDSFGITVIPAKE
ncbi:MAG: hypothetical protein HYW26_02840 [Candidatus Aenigmarchaeota archaeon]|nr:hypothetical protein [Candidatus Aenigmarchaeota archaeon]